MKRFLRWFVGHVKIHNVCPIKCRRMKMIRHASGIVLGICIGMSGCGVACNAEFLSHAYLIPHVIADFAGYTLHAIGIIPLVSHAEPLWVLIMAEVD